MLADVVAIIGTMVSAHTDVKFMSPADACLGSGVWVRLITLAFGLSVASTNILRVLLHREVDR